MLLVEGQHPLFKIILPQGNSNCLETKNKQKCQEDEGIYLSTKLVEIVGYRFSCSNICSSYNLFNASNFGGGSKLLIIILQS
jgi:hypothetical protein